MCLLMTSTSSNLRTVLLDTSGLIHDIYDHNSDGLGVMYHTTNGMKVVKALPRSAAEARAVIEKLPTDDRQVALHWRMRTHGHIDKENCHPYPIGHGAYLMHNGVLKTGNAGDTTKSDTWHFARDYLSTMDADTLHNPQYLMLLGEFIGNNRFVIATADGRMSWVNEDQGVESHGIVFSNTYAWSPEILMPQYYNKHHVSSYDWMYRVPATGYAPSMSEGIDWDNYNDDHLSYDEVAECVMTALAAYDEDTLTELLRTEFGTTADVILDRYGIDTDARYTPSENSVAINLAVTTWVKGDLAQLRRMAPEPLAQALLYCCDVYELEDDEVPLSADEMEELDELIGRGTA